MKILASQLNFTIGDVRGNGQKIREALARAKEGGADVVLFSELAITGYPPEDLLLDHRLIDAAERQLQELAPLTKGLFVVVGLPRVNPQRKEKPLHNSAAVLIDGELIGFVDKQLLPTYDVFDERRYFEPGEAPQVFAYRGKKIGVLICEDAWQHAGGVGYTDYRKDPVADYAQQGIDLLLNASASPYHYKKKDRRLSLFVKCAEALRCPIVVCNQVGANDQLVFDGYSFCVDEKGQWQQSAQGFVEEDLWIELPAQASSATPQDLTGDLYRALCLGVRDYFHKQSFNKAFLGLSGGIDSALVACIATDALGKENVRALSLPSRFSSPSSLIDAARLSQNLGLALEKISIDELLTHYIEALSPHFTPSELVLENIQSRIRGHVLMAFSNQFGALLLNTGNKSEMAMGYTTLYGDMAGGLGVLHDVNKTRVYELARFVNRQQEIIPTSILEKAPSAELRPNQKDTDTLPPFDLLDPILEDYLEEFRSPEEIAARQGQLLPFVQEIIKTIHRSEYKRRQAPIGIRVTPKAFSKGRNVPIVQTLI